MGGGVMGHRDWPKLNVLKADYCEARGLDPSRTVVELWRPGGEWAVKQHWVITEQVGYSLREEDEPCDCPEVADITEEMLDDALRRVLLGIVAVKLRRRVEELR
jgi:hypothetical protein